jgi:hypothetical protein
MITRRILALVCVLTATGCSSSASLVRQGKLPKACRKARDETQDEQRALQEWLFAEAAPRLALDMLDATTSATLKKLVGNRYSNIQFARVSLVLDPKRSFQAQMSLVSMADHNAYYPVRYIDEQVAADLVYPRPDVQGLVDGVGVVPATMIMAVAILHRLAETDSDRLRYEAEFVDADPDLRGRKEALLDAAKDGAPLVVVLPGSAGFDTPVVRLNLVLRTRFLGPGAGCSYQQHVVVELKDFDDIHHAAARELSGRPRPISSLHPTLNEGTPEEPNRTGRLD